MASREGCWAGPIAGRSDRWPAPAAKGRLGQITQVLHGYVSWDGQVRGESRIRRDETGPVAASIHDLPLPLPLLVRRRKPGCHPAADQTVRVSRS